MEVEVDDQIPFINRDDDDGGLLPSSVIKIARAFYVATNEKAALTGSSILRYAMSEFEMDPFPLVDHNGRCYDFDLFVCCEQSLIRRVLESYPICSLVDMKTFESLIPVNDSSKIDGIVGHYKFRVKKGAGQNGNLRRIFSVITMDESIMQGNVGMVEGYKFGEAVVRRFDLDIVQGWLDFPSGGGIEIRYPDDPISEIRTMIQAKRMTYILSSYSFPISDHYEVMYSRLEKYMRRGFSLVAIVFGSLGVFGEGSFRQPMPTLRFENARVDHRQYGRIYSDVSSDGSTDSSDDTLFRPIVFRRI